jgi:hypothetical protein
MFYSASKIHGQMGECQIFKEALQHAAVWLKHFNALMCCSQLTGERYIAVHNPIFESPSPLAFCDLSHKLLQTVKYQAKPELQINSE